MKYSLKEKKTLPKSQIELVIEIPADEVSARERETIADIRERLELPGFRRGHVPEDVVRTRVGDAAVWEETAFQILPEVLAEIIGNEQLRCVGHPAVLPLKLSPKNEAAFKVTLSLLPILPLPDYKGIAAEENRAPEETITVEEREIDEVLAEIAKQRAGETGTKDSAEGGGAKEPAESRAAEEGLRKRVRSQIEEYRRDRAKEQRRAKLLDRIIAIAGAPAELPEILIEGELDRMEGELRGEIEWLNARMEGMPQPLTFDGFLKEIKKDREALRKEWRADAEKRARLRLILARIAQAENLAAPQERVEDEVKRLIRQHKDLDETAVRAFVEAEILNREAIAFLERL